MLEGLLLDLCLPIFQSFGLMISFQSRMRFCRAWLVSEGLQTVHMSCPVRLFLVHEKKSDQGKRERQKGECGRMGDAFMMLGIVAPQCVCLLPCHCSLLSPLWSSALATQSTSH